MSMSLQAAANTNFVSDEIMAKIILDNDLSGLSHVQQADYIKGLCRSLGLNPATCPIKLMKFQGKLVPYASKDATEQLRHLHKVSISKIETKIHEGGIYVVTAYATTNNGRQDCSTAALVIQGLKGESLSNAMMKCETKAKRRVTLSICGLGLCDESEIDTLPNVQKIDVTKFETIKPVAKLIDIPVDITFEASKTLVEIQNCDSIDELKVLFESARLKFAKDSPEHFEKIVNAKDKRKEELLTIEELDDLSFDKETGEVIQ